MVKIDVNDISAESRIALLNFTGAFIGLERILKKNGASPAEIEKGALEAIQAIIAMSPKEKNKIEQIYLGYTKEV